MNQLSPNESFVINRILKDHTDTDTHYVQAVVYDSTTRAVLSTLNLTDNGNRWFSKAFKVPYGDAFSIGRHILIITSVYDDAAYTTKSPNYAEESEEHLIQQRWSPTLSGAGSGGIDYREIAKVLAEVLNKQPSVELPVQKEFPIKELLSGVEKMVKQIPLPKEPNKPKEIDFSSLESGLEKVVKKIESIPTPKLDLSPVIGELKNLVNSIKELTAENKNYTEEIIEKIGSKKIDTERIISDISNEIKNKINNGEIKFSIFGDKNPFSNTEEKRNTYLQMLAKKYAK